MIHFRLILSLKNIADINNDKVTDRLWFSGYNTTASRYFAESVLKNELANKHPAIITTKYQIGFSTAKGFLISKEFFLSVFRKTK